MGNITGYKRCVTTIIATEIITIPRKKDKDWLLSFQLNTVHDKINIPSLID